MSKFRPNKHLHYSSHLPLLMKIVSMTKGNVLELGTGFFSTPVLHWLCFPDRYLESYDADKKFYDEIKYFETDSHKINFVEDWDKIDIEKPWDVVFIDHEKERRYIEAIRMAKYAQFVILHDTCGRDNKHYQYDKVYPHYKYKYQFPLVRPKTSVLSNFVDVTKLKLW